DTTPRAQTAHGYGRDLIDVRPVAELSVVVFPPCEDGPVGAQRETVRVPGRDRDDAATGTEPGDLRRCAVPRGRGSVADLTLRVVTPREHRAIGLHRQHVIVARGHADDVADAGDLPRPRVEVAGPRAGC